MNGQQLIWAGAAITGENFTPCHDFGVCVEGSSIVATGSRQELCNIYPQAKVIGSERLLLVPGMVNSHDHGRAISTVAQGVSDDQLEIWLMHLLETPYQRQYAYRKWGKSFVQHLAEISAVGSWLTCAHMVWVEPDDLSRLALEGVGIAHNPSSNLRLGSGMAPLAQMLAAGIELGIGLDGLALDDDQDFLREMRLAWTLSNYSQENARTVNASSIWSMGTTGGVAVTLGKDVPLGKLTPGYLADLVLLNWEDNSPLTLDKLLRCGTRHQVNSVMVGGHWVVKNGKSQTLDRETIEREMRGQLARHSKNQLQQSARVAHNLAPYLRSFYSQWHGTK